MSAPYKIIEIVKNARWTVTSAEGMVYDVAARSTGGLRCSCKSYKYRGTCRHLPMVPYDAPRRFPRSTIGALGAALLDMIAPVKGEIVGSYRRERPDSKDIDLIVLGDEDWWYETVLPTLDGVDNVHIAERGDVQIRGTYCGVPFDVSRVDEEDDWVWYLIYRTGSRDFNIKMRGHAKSLGFKMNEHGLFWPDGSRLEFYPDAEIEVFERLGLPWVEPKDR